MNKRTRTTLFIAALVLALLAGAVYLRKNAPPEAARLLPESDGILYVNLRPLRAATHFDQHPVTHPSDYQNFIDATGIVWERDLDEAAFALHHTDNPFGPNGAVAYSYVLVGKLDGKRFAKYFAAQAADTESYEGHQIYAFRSDGRTVRVTQLGYDIVAITNTPTAEQIHSIVDRYRTAALPFAGSTLLSQHYTQVPLLSMAWGIGKIGLPLVDAGRLKLLGFQIPVAVDTTFVASLRWVGALHLRVEEYAPSEAAAAVSATGLQSIVAVARAAESAFPDTATNTDIKNLLNSTQITQSKDRMIVTATIPQNIFQHLVSPPALGGTDPRTDPRTDTNPSPAIQGQDASEVKPPGW
jgi:hypothetical protein